MAVVELEGVREGLSLLTLNRPERLNAMNHELVAALYEALDLVDLDMLTGRFVDAEGAARIGLVSRFVPDGEVVQAALEIADQIDANSPFGVWMTKEVMWSNLEASSLEAAIDLENRTQILTTFTEDMAEAVRAFLEKRPPRFRNA